MSTAPRSVAQALAFAQAQHDHPTQSWSRRCLVFVQSCYAIPARDATAYDAWLNTPNAHKHVGGDPNDAPVGAALCYKGSDPAGHIMLAGHILDNLGGWSNDLVNDGAIDKVDRHAPITEWGHKYLGYITQVEGYDLPIVQPKPPAPIAPPKEPVVPIDTPYTRTRARLVAAVNHPDARAIAKGRVRFRAFLATIRAGLATFGKA